MTEEESPDAEVVPEEEALTLRKTIEQQQAELVALEQENLSLRERQQTLEERQIRTEEAILSAGGKITIPFPEIRSPNVRRRDAILFKQRFTDSDSSEEDN